MIGGVNLRNRVFLAPMSGVTDLPFRARAHAHGAGLVVTEMIASGELVRERPDSGARLRRSEVDVHMVQLAGREAGAMAEAARIAVGEGADIVDINMGCPAKKVTGGYCGSALMRDPDHALRLIGAVVGAVGAPVTVKMRLGWDDQSLNAPQIAARAEAAGVRMVTIHGRTRCQFYEGRADWSAIRAVKQAVTIPVVANGDIGCLAAAADALKNSSADAVMVGRAAYGSPWLPAQIAAQARQGQAMQMPRSAEALADYIAAHYEDMLAHYGRERGVRQARKHLGWYLDCHSPFAPPALRHLAMTSFDPAIVIAALREAFIGATVSALDAAA
ncbi:MAG TPA: tRNA dihydrouridine synthase DusB [Mesorhizobium sp.]|nr:tRNA dihydrouridine synthase DusB [Mesorhizobium sp.]